MSRRGAGHTRTPQSHTHEVCRYQSENFFLLNTLKMSTKSFSIENEVIILLMNSNKATNNFVFYISHYICISKSNSPTWVKFNIFLFNIFMFRSLFFNVQRSPSTTAQLVNADRRRSIDPRSRLEWCAGYAPFSVTWKVIKWWEKWRLLLGRFASKWSTSLTRAVTWNTKHKVSHEKRHSRWSTSRECIMETDRSKTW